MKKYLILLFSNFSDEVRWKYNRLEDKYRTFKRYIRNCYIYKDALSDSMWYNFDSGYYMYLKIHLEQMLHANNTGLWVFPSVNHEKYMQQARIALEYTNRLIDCKTPFDFYLDGRKTAHKDTFYHKPGNKIGNTVLFKSEDFYRKGLHKILGKYLNSWWD